MLLDRRLRPEYNCAHYATELWLLETGQDLGDAMSGFLAPLAQRRAPHALRRSFRKLPCAVSPCIVLFKRANTAPHVGIFLRGRVQHLTKSGPIRQLLDVAATGYQSVRFYAPSSHL